MHVTSVRDTRCCGFYAAVVLCARRVMFLQHVYIALHYMKAKITVSSTRAKHCASAAVENLHKHHG